MNFSFKKRIALFNSIAVAITIAVVFIVIYFVVSFSSYQHLDTDLKTVLNETKETVFKNIDKGYYVDKYKENGLIKEFCDLRTTRVYMKK